MEFNPWTHSEKTAVKRIYINGIAGLTKEQRIYLKPRLNKTIQLCFSENIDNISDLENDIWRVLTSRFAISKQCSFYDLWRQLKEARTLDPNKLPIQLSMLEQMPGVGHDRALALLSKFITLAAIMKASVSSIATTSGISEPLAEEIHNYLN